MKNWTAQHWTLVSGFLMGTATVIAGLSSWSELASPAVVAGLLLQFATVLGAVYADKPEKPEVY